jgi:S1-C subfamily serine protease
MHLGWIRRFGAIGVTAAALFVSVGADEPARKAVGLPRVDRPLPVDNLTFRPTVLIRKGPRASGSGIVIASVPGDTLVLTAAHVLNNEGDLVVELHRFNLGLEQVRVGGQWPHLVPAEVVAVDASADVAALRIRGLRASLPFVARMAMEQGEPGAGTVVTSVGIDREVQLSSWTARIKGVTMADPNKTGHESPFLVIDRPPDHGRSGGGLFRPDGRLVGLCTGRQDRPRTQSIGVFSSSTSLRRLLNVAHLMATVNVSDEQHFVSATQPERVPITPTQNRQPEP